LIADKNAYREMSGIKKSTEQQQGQRRTGPKPTLEENYQQIREAAEAFQILQVGICCVEEDHEKGMAAVFFNTTNYHNNDSLQDSTSRVLIISICLL